MSDKDTIIGQPVERRADWIEQEHVTPPMRGTEGQQDAKSADALHNQIMNLPCKPGQAIAMNGASKQAYQEGHRDARHAAAELVAEVASRCRAQGGNTQQSPDWIAYHSALSASAELLDNMADGDPITDLPKFLAAKLAACAPADLSEAMDLMSKYWTQQWTDADGLRQVRFEYKRLESAVQALAQEREAVPEGFMLVPIVSTLPMDRAGCAAITEGSMIDAECCWNAMLAAAPSAPAEQSSMAGSARQGGNTQGEQVAPTPSDSASVDTDEQLYVLIVNYRMAETVGLERYKAIVAYIKSLIDARVAGVRKDAERLDWLETAMASNHESTPYHEEGVGFGYPYLVHGSPIGGGVGFHNCGSLREAIDAARAAHSPASVSKS